VGVIILAAVVARVVTRAREVQELLGHRVSAPLARVALGVVAAQVTIIPVPVEVWVFLGRVLAGAGGLQRCVLPVEVPVPAAPVPCMGEAPVISADIGAQFVLCGLETLGRSHQPVQVHHNLYKI